MNKHKMISLIFVALAMMMQACVAEAPKSRDASTVESQTKFYDTKKENLTSPDFKIPLSPDYNWEITQSWKDHCGDCNSKGYDKISNGYYGDFCQLTHSTLDVCKYGWDLSLSGSADLGKPALASADGVAKLPVTNGNTTWGNYVLIDHGNNICTRYAHLRDGTITVSNGQKVCQGLKIGEIGGTPSYSPHLHFQFESCDKHVPLKMGFTDGNGEPKCTIGSDIMTNGVYTALNLTNLERGTCGWNEAGCGEIYGCPMKSCANSGKMPFGDSFDSRTAMAVSYLWHECAINGKSDGYFHPEDKLTRAEGLKIALELFGMANGCSISNPFKDVKPKDWFYPYVMCGVKHGIIDTKYKAFNPNGYLYFSESAKILVETAAKAGKIKIKSSSPGHYAKIQPGHWAYKYVETIFFYGGVNFSLPEKDAYAKANRGEFAVMAAALSPCFCQSVKCGNDCSCNQENYSCENSTVYLEPEPDPKSGGIGVPPNEPTTIIVADAGSSSTSDVKSCKQITCQSMSVSCGEIIDGCGNVTNCGSCPDGYTCTGSMCEKFCYTCESAGVECGKLSNACGKILDCGSCPSGYSCSFAKCKKNTCQPATCASMGIFCGLVGDGCGKTLNCGSCGNGYNCEAGTCKQSCKPKTCTELKANCGNPSNGCGGTLKCGYCASGTYCDEATAQCKTATCDPAKGYTVTVDSPGGAVQVLKNGGSPGDFIWLTSEEKYKFACSELPVAMIVISGTPMVKIAVGDAGLPAFAVWMPYNGAITANPVMKPDVVTTDFYSGSSSNSFNLLLRFPAK